MTRNSKKSSKNFDKNDSDGADRLDALARACEGLKFISEIDADIVPFVGTEVKRVAADEVRQMAGRGPDAVIEERDVEEFFARLTAAKPWHGVEHREKIKRFLVLKRQLEESLVSLSVFRVGQVRLDIYIAGLDRDGRLAGVRTEAVET